MDYYHSCTLVKPALFIKHFKAASTDQGAWPYKLEEVAGDWEVWASA